MFADTQWAWDSEVPLQAESNAFLMRALIAVSALHVCYLEPQSSMHYYAAACSSYATATVLFRRAVNNIDKDNCIAVLAFSLLVSIHQFGIMQLACLHSMETTVHYLDTISASGRMVAHHTTASLSDSEQGKRPH